MCRKGGNSRRKVEVRGTDFRVLVVGLGRMGGLKRMNGEIRGTDVKFLGFGFWVLGWVGWAGNKRRRVGRMGAKLVPI